jgi:adenosylmethionine-8-amino-7-oxononanoate aminotransferase
VLELETLLRSELTALAARRPSVREVRVGGFMGGVSLVDGIPAEHVTDDLIELGFVSRPLRGNTLQISPPFITTDDELRALIAAFDEALQARESA